jgi:hypothetical protein
MTPTATQPWTTRSRRSCVRALGSRRRCSHTCTHPRQTDNVLMHSLSSSAFVIHWLAQALVVVPGFIATSHVGTTTTLGRSGSDYTATILGAVLCARKVVIWTDGERWRRGFTIDSSDSSFLLLLLLLLLLRVPSSLPPPSRSFPPAVYGVYSADPRLVKGTYTLPSISYREAAEMAFFGYSSNSSCCMRKYLRFSVFNFKISR